MDLQTLETGNELLAKYRLCETMLEYLSDPEAIKGQKYNERCGEFFKVFHDEMLTVTHDLMTKCGEQFYDLHCPEHSEQPDIPTPPTEEKEPKFPIGSFVEILSGVYRSNVGHVKNFDAETGDYYVVSDNFSMWFKESDLKVYEEEENPDYHPTINDFAVNDRIEIVAGALTGMKGMVVGLNVEENLLDVVLDGDEESSSFTPSEVRKIEPEISDKDVISIGDKVIIIDGKYAGNIGYFYGFDEDGYLAVQFSNDDDYVYFSPEMVKKYTETENFEENG